MHSFLLIHVNKPYKITEAAISSAYAVIIDVGVSIPKYQKEHAMKISMEILGNIPKTIKPYLFIGLSNLSSEEIEVELDLFMTLAPKGVFLSECADAADIQHIGAMLAVMEAKNNLEDGVTDIIVDVTSNPAALLNLADITKASNRLKAISWNPQNLQKSLKAEKYIEKNGNYTSLFVHARSMVLFAAAAAGIKAIDAPCLDVGDSLGDNDVLIKECNLAKRDGFAGKIAKNQSQVNIINSIGSDLYPA